jgi:hypothetical protein
MWRAFTGVGTQKIAANCGAKRYHTVLVRRSTKDSGMLRLSSCFVTAALLVAASVAPAQEAPSGETVTCNFDTDKQLAAQYQPIRINLKKPLFGQEIAAGKVWAPGGKPITLFANAPFEVGGKQLGIGAYTMFVLPTPKLWTLIISRSTDISGKYDETMDLVRVPMESGELTAPEPQLNVAFAHLGPDQCSLRLEVATVGTDVVFTRK